MDMPCVRKGDHRQTPFPPRPGPECECGGKKRSWGTESECGVLAFCTPRSHIGEPWYYRELKAHDGAVADIHHPSPPISYLRVPSRTSSLRDGTPRYEIATAAPEPSRHLPKDPCRYRSTVRSLPGKDT
ncbi:hypothetical protein MANAM107_20650 [Actinomyces capricornis]|uniref:Uncharacterized protein n=1 Tax=Actinomyces capricornis TaxID=2755559 RepID=A0ABM7UDI9_9ACTO|nr:hypothetical protein MANAM107_20650 [Actinomyces capricornis]